MSALTGKVAIVTGASSGIGRAAAVLFAREGARIIAAARRSVELEELAAEIAGFAGVAVPLAGDVRDEEFAKRMVETAVARFGGLDVAFNNAGALGELGPASDLSAAEWTATLETNLTSAFLCAKYQIPALSSRGGGSIIFTSTFVGYVCGFPGMVAYAASKAGLIGLTRVLAVELGSKRIRVNAILPGGTDTPMRRIVASTAQAREAIAQLHALKRIAAPEEIAKSALYLASEASSFTTGSALLVDGGVSISKL
ncbi:MAG TPA: SDR family oxidoreductase [Steroidobacteraceae bacterium]|jgi:NAD(P)-dependent dehydrogenase (short-subunit alcohol dehydrogenase family)